VLGQKVIFISISFLFFASEFYTSNLFYNSFMVLGCLWTNQAEGVASGELPYDFVLNLGWIKSLVKSFQD